MIDSGPPNPCLVPSAWPSAALLYTLVVFANCYGGCIDGYGSSGLLEVFARE